MRSCFQALLSTAALRHYLQVLPAAFDLRMSELYFWDPTTKTLDELDKKRSVADFFYSSLNKLTHNFKMSDGRPVMPVRPDQFQIKVGQRTFTLGWKQFDPTLAFRNFQLLKLKSNKLLSNFGFNFNLRRYIKGVSGEESMFFFQVGRCMLTPG